MDKLWEDTQPDVWLEPDLAPVASDAESLTRCRGRLLRKLPRLWPQEAVDLAADVGGVDYLRARLPEAVADKLASADSDPFASRLEVDST